jgi:alginate O-acetyltransferase complex protein AlgJ
MSTQAQREPASRPFSDRVRRNGKYSVLPLLFLALISLPLLDQMLQLTRRPPVNEKRRLAKRPSFSLKDPLGFFQKYESFFNDHFGLRSQLVYLHNLFQVTVFQTSSVDKVLIGKNGWLFMGRENRSRSEVSYFRSLKLFTPAELEHWHSVLRQRRQWLERRGILYLFLVVPNKSTVYPEFMPANLRKLNPQSRLDQLLAMLAKDPGFPVIDFRETLRKEKDRLPLYYRTDSHWTEVGAYFAYRQVMEKLAQAFPRLQLTPLEQYSLEYRNRFYGDLAQMLSLHGGKFKEEGVSLRRKLPTPFATSTAKRRLGPYIRMTVSECPGADLPTILIVHDSFMHQLKPFFKPHFRRIVYIWDWGLHFFLKEIEREKPRIVIDELVERGFSDLVPVNPSELLEADAE